MNSNKLDEEKLLEILALAKEGEQKLKAMSDFATVMAEKWQSKAESKHTTAQKSTSSTG